MTGSEIAAIEYNFYVWVVLLLLPLDFCQDWNGKHQWLLIDPLCGFVGSQTQINLEDGSVGGTNMATGNPVCPFSSVGKTFKHLFLPVVKHFYQPEFG